MEVDWPRATERHINSNGHSTMVYWREKEETTFENSMAPNNRDGDEGGRS